MLKHILNLDWMNRKRLNQGWRCNYTIDNLNVDIVVSTWTNKNSTLLHYLQGKTKYRDWVFIYDFSVGIPHKVYFENGAVKIFDPVCNVTFQISPLKWLNCFWKKMSHGQYSVAGLINVWNERESHIRNYFCKYNLAYWKTSSLNFSHI